MKYVGGKIATTNLPPRPLPTLSNLGHPRFSNKRHFRQFVVGFRKGHPKILQGSNPHNRMDAFKRPPDPAGGAARCRVRSSRLRALRALRTREVRLPEMPREVPLEGRDWPEIFVGRKF